MASPLEIFDSDLLNGLGDELRPPFYNTPGKVVKPAEEIDYLGLCYRGTENKKPTYVLEIDVTVEVFAQDSDKLFSDLKLAEHLRVIFVKEKKYLWVIDEHYELHVLPEITQNPSSDRGHICHTNITAGKHARHGGELWYGTDSIVFLNNSSGRFFTKDSGEWSYVVKYFLKAGYKKVVDIDQYKNERPVIYEP